MLHIHIGPDIEKKTEKDDVECEDDLILACQLENPGKHWILISVKIK